jgi:monoamine oxidase
MAEVDVCVIGAGAAGLAAGITLQKLGKTFRILEARNRIGGRAWTDHHSFPGIPFDRGAHWLHSASRNPLVAAADQLGWRYAPGQSYKPRHLFLGDGTQADEETIRRSREALRRALRAIECRGASEDVAFSDCLPKKSPWHLLTSRTLAQMMGEEPDQCSTADYAHYEDTGEDWPVEDGYGALIERLAAAVPVDLSARVHTIDARGSLIRVEATTGTVKARSCIITLPTTVLASGVITFRPGLPPSVMQTFHDCPMGVFEKIAILLDRPIDGLSHAYSDVIDGLPIRQAPVNLHVHPFGRPLLVAHVAGREGEKLVAQGPSAMKLAGIDVLRRAFGSDVVRRIKAIEVTGWRRDPFSLGSYAHCLPGRAEARSTMNTPFDDRIAFAGEHLWESCFATVHGAWLSGVRAAVKLGRP